MDKLATILGAAKLVAHRLHNTVRGSDFFADHAFLGETYDAYDDTYDAVVERAIGTGEPIDLAQVNTNAAAMAAATTADPDLWYVALLGLEVQIRTEIDVLGPRVSTGTANLLAQLADDSEVRTYKLNQRVDPEDAA